MTTSYRLVDSEATILNGEASFIPDARTETVAAHAARPAIAAERLVAAERSVLDRGGTGIKECAAKGRARITAGTGRATTLRRIGREIAIADFQRSGAAIVDPAPLTRTAGKTDGLIVGQGDALEGQVAGGIVDAAALRCQAVGDGQAGDGDIRPTAG